MDNGPSFGAAVGVGLGLGITEAVFGGPQYETVIFDNGGVTDIIEYDY